MILLFSGGLDSYIGWHYLGEPQTVYFDLNTDYAFKEVNAIKKLIPSTIIDSSLDLFSRQTETETAYVPFRNLYLAMLAAKYDDYIVICGLKDDQVSDKNESIFKEFSNLLSKLEGRQIAIRSPFFDTTKENIVKWFCEYFDPSLLLGTVSCYSKTSETYCGKCPSCFRKWNALYANGLTLPFANEELMIEYLQKARDGKYIPERNHSIITCVEKFLEI